MVIARQHHSTFTRGDVLIWVEAECRDVPKRTNRANVAGPITIPLANLFSRILDNFQAMAFENFHHWRHIHRKPIDMDDHDRLRPRCDRTRDLVRIHVPGKRLGIHYDRHRARPYNRRSTGDDSKGRQNNLVPWSYSKSGDGEIERHRSVHHSDAIALPGNQRHSLLKFANKGALRGYPAGFDALREVFSLVSIQQWFVHRDHGAEPCDDSRQLLVFAIASSIQIQGPRADL